MSPSPGPVNEDKINQPFYPVGEQSPICDFVIFKPKDGLIGFSALSKTEGDRTLSYEYSGKEIPTSLDPTGVKIDPLEPSAPIVLNYKNGEWLQWQS